MIEKPTTGFFITLEGGEGTGKTTQIKHLQKSLSEAGHDVVVTREPGGTPEAEKIRNLLAQADGGDWTTEAECLLFFAARAMHIQTLIIPSMKAGKVVICDRFTDSTRVYQSFGRGIERDFIENLNRLSINGFDPDLTFILDLSVDTGLARAGKRLENSQSGEDRFERLGKEFHEKVRQGFLELSKEYHDRCVVIDADRNEDKVAKDILHRSLSSIEKSKQGRKEGASHG